jgi:autotransporter-associated beta strand protein
MKPRILSTARLSFALASALAALLAAPTALHAISLTWDSDGTTTPGPVDGGGVWLTANQWWDGAANTNWTTGDDASFGNAGAGGAVTLASPTTVNSLTLNSFTGTYTLGTAGQTITLTTGLTMNAGAGAATIISPVTLGGAQSWLNNSSGLLTVGTGAVTNGGYLLTVGGSSNTTVSSVIGGAGGLTKTGTGILTLSGTNTFTGQLSVQNGTLSIATIANVATNGTLGAGNSAVPVILGNPGAQTGTLQYTGATATSTKPFTLAGGGTGAFEVTTGANTLTLSGLINGGGGLTKLGAGTLVLSNNANQITGPVSISGGKLKFGAAYALWKAAYDTTGSTGAIGLDLTGQTTPVLGGLAGNVDLATAATAYNLVTALTLNPQTGTSVSYSGVIANGAANMTLTKTGYGTQTLTGANTYSGATTLYAGTLALGGASGSILNSTVTVNGGTLALDNSTAWADRLTDGTALSLGSLTLTSFNGAGTQTETVGNTTFGYSGKVTINLGGGSDQTTLALGTVSRSVGAAIDFVGTGGTLGSGANSPNVSSAAAFPGTVNGILPWATVGGTQWAEDNSGSIRAYSGTFDDPTSAASDATRNAQLTGTGALASAMDFNSLTVIATGAGQSLNLTGGNLTLTSPGAILKSGTDAYAISSSNGNITAGTELIAHVDGGDLTISAPLNTAIVGLAKGGTGKLILSGTRAGTFSGAMSIAGTLEFQGAGTTLSGAISGPGGLTCNLNSGQRLAFLGRNKTYSGPTVVKGGALQLGNAWNGQSVPSVGGLLISPARASPTPATSNSTAAASPSIIT